MKVTYISSLFAKDTLYFDIMFYIHIITVVTCVNLSNFLKMSYQLI